MRCQPGNQTKPGQLGMSFDQHNIYTNESTKLLCDSLLVIMHVHIAISLKFELDWVRFFRVKWGYTPNGETH